MDITFMIKGMKDRKLDHKQHWEKKKEALEEVLYLYNLYRVFLFKI